MPYTTNWPSVAKFAREQVRCHAKIDPDAPQRRVSTIERQMPGISHLAGTA